MNTLELHGRSYRLPQTPVVVICIDGCDPEYISDAIRRDICPNFAYMVNHGFGAIADCVMPSFTNPNNVSIVTGAPPRMHGIAGNYFLDRTTGEEVMINDARFLQGSTLLAGLAKAGIATAAITAKDKLTKLIGHELEGICFSSEKAGSTSLAAYGLDSVEALVGRPQPDMYSPDLSLYVIDAGIELLRRGLATVLYLSLSDYVQHKNAPGTEESDDFLVEIDRRLGQLIALGATVACVADHGMSDKTTFQGVAQLLFVEDELNDLFGDQSARVICPITDPFVRHHGALGSFVRVYLADQAHIAPAAAAIRAMPGVHEVMLRQEAADRLSLPYEFEADLVVISKQDWALGSSRERHDLGAVQDRPLRTHGGFSEQRVPFLISKPLNSEGRKWAANVPLHNYDIFYAVLNFCS